MRFIFFLVVQLIFCPVFAQDLPSPAEDKGQEIYEKFCAVCHRDGLVGAPKFRVQADWESHLAHKTLDDLLNSAIKGVNAMPAKGTCFECDDEELKKAIQFMLPKS